MAVTVWAAPPGTEARRVEAMERLIREVSPLAVALTSHDKAAELERSIAEVMDE